MARNDAQYRMWLELVGEILQQPPGLPTAHEEHILALLNQSFNSALSGRNLVGPAWDNHILAAWPRNYIPDEPPGEYDLRQQPLLRWYMFTGQSEPQSCGRVPEALASNRLQQAWEETARPWNINQQLSIPLRVGGVNHNTYLIQRSDRDFTEQEMDLARLLQPILTGLALHIAVVPMRAGDSTQHSNPGLTIREMSILTLLSKGLTAESLARRLNISPRTAEKHLEHVYRKLDVCDRLMAVQTAHELGILNPSSATSRQNQHS
ncbi:DNA-binding response regulator [Arthrobacter crusticola]|uniref:DNA-binding response regulator n=1 Tax=Arthrobacter crusticola TaxID=2547960 RepID=A0A4R5TUX7_9MICC|nr:LuxR C-terminal-related transcriptional regulator [Arthrobacter crusticola]TDK24839.1 DNA-binding response regulator [Arthrobacter crusticola]